MDLTLRVWRQAGPDAAGRFETYAMPGVSEDMSFLELFDVLNEKLVAGERGARSRSTTTAARASAGRAP